MSSIGEEYMDFIMNEFRAPYGNIWKSRVTGAGGNPPGTGIYWPKTERTGGTAAVPVQSEEFRIMTRTPFAATALLLVLVQASGTAADTAILSDGSSPAAGSVVEFRLLPVADTAAVAAGLVWAAGSVLIDDGAPPAVPDALAREAVNAFDRAAMFRYSGTLDTISDFTQYLAFLTPAALAFSAPGEEWFTIGTMYLEASLFSFGAKNFLKYAVSRYRPYMYTGSAPEEALADGDFADSFPSGHTTMAFTGAAFASWLFAQYNPDSPLSIPFTAAAYSLAAATAVLRVTSGSHFMSDVLTGAAIGTASGILVPLLHTRHRGTADDTVSFALTARGPAVTIRY